MKRLFFLIGGLAAMALGTAGIFLPLLPTVPFMILAAFCFARSSPQLEARLLADPVMGPHIRSWRHEGAISRRGKGFALAAFTASALFGLFLLAWPFNLLPLAAAFIGGGWIATRPLPSGAAFDESA
jgi:uncharacterized membrane protein YbaN (DUF454 family)